MINIGKILKRAWHILWNYKILWIFGFLLAITAGGQSGNSGSSANSNYQFNVSNGSSGINSNSPAFLRNLNAWFQQNILPMVNHPANYIATFIWIGVGLVLFLLFLGAIFVILRYVSETAVIRMVDEYEQSGTKMGFKQGWKLGWSRRAFRMWLIDLITALPYLLFLLVVIGFGVGIYFSVKSGNPASTAIVIVTAIGVISIFILALTLWTILLSLLRQFFFRMAALENKGVRDSLRMGWHMFKRNWKSASLMWLVMVGIWIASMIAIFIAFFLLIPVDFLLALPGAIVAAIPGLAVFGITSIFTSGPLAWILGLLAAVPFFLLIVFAPVTLLSGWYKIYESSVWTLTFREIKALENVSPAENQASAK